MENKKQHWIDHFEAKKKEALIAIADFDQKAKRLPKTRDATAQIAIELLITAIQDQHQSKIKLYEQFILILKD